MFHLVCNFFLHINGRAGYPLSRGNDLFNDFTIFEDKFVYFHTQAFWQVGFPINYPAPCIVAFELFFHFLKRWDVFGFELFCVLALVIPAGLFARTLTRRGMAVSQAVLFCLVMTLFSWPGILIFDRGNIEILVWLALATGMWAYATGRLWTAAAFFGFGASLKLFPFVLLGLFLSRKQYGKFIFGIVVFTLISWVSMAVVGPTVVSAYHGIASGLGTFKQVYMSAWRPDENGVDHSMFALFKLCAYVCFHHKANGFTRTLTAYLWTVAGGGVLIYFVRIRKLPLLNQVLALTISSIYFTAFSGDGTLVHLYAPCAMLLLLAQKAWQDNVRIPGLSSMLGCMTVLLSCETFLVHKDQRYIGPLHCVVLGFLLLLALLYPLGPPLDQTDSETILSAPETWWVLERETKSGTEDLRTMDENAFATGSQT